MPPTFSRGLLRRSTATSASHNPTTLRHELAVQAVRQNEISLPSCPPMPIMPVPLHPNATVPRISHSGTTAPPPREHVAVCRRAPRLRRS